jgi:hypothetical protein
MANGKENEKQQRAEMPRAAAARRLGQLPRNILKSGEKRKSSIKAKKTAYSRKHCGAGGVAQQRVA